MPDLPPSRQNPRLQSLRLPRSLFAGIAIAVLASVTVLLLHRPPPPHHPPPPRDVSTIVKIDGQQLFLQTDDGWSKTVRYDDSTRIHRGREVLDARALQPGVRVRVHDRRTGDEWLAVDIDLHDGARPPHPPPHGLVATFLGAGLLVFYLRARGKR